MIGSYGADYLRSISEIWPFSRVSSPFAREEGFQGSPYSDHQVEICLATRRFFPQEIHQTPPNQARSQKAINCLTVNKRIRIISIVTGIQRSIFKLQIAGGVYGKG